MQDHYCVNFRSNDERSKSGENLSFFNFSSNDLLRSKWIVATRHDEGPDFEISKSRVVTSALLAGRIIGDRLCLSISDSANSFFFCFLFLWRWTDVPPLLLPGPQIFFSLIICSVSALYPPWSMQTAMRSVSPVIILNIFSGWKWAELTRSMPFFIWQIHLKPQIFTRKSEGESQYILPS